jgi:site-specific recombinase XerD
MKHSDFAYYLTNFLSKYLPGERGLSKNTISSYRDTFILFLKYMKTVGKSVEQINLNDISKSTISNFLTWLEESRQCSARTRNVRLSAIQSFYKFLQYENPDQLSEYKQILKIPKKKFLANTFSYLTVDGVKLLLSQPDINIQKGRRDLALLVLMYDTGARVQEFIDLTPGMFNLNKPITVKLIGKGNKCRIIPLLDNQVTLVLSYMKESNLDLNENNMHPLFTNKFNNKFTRAGVNYIINKYADIARKINPSLIPNKMSPHTLRHSKAMHLLQSGVNLVYIRDILGHSSIQSNEIYIHTDTKQKRLELEKTYETKSVSQSIWEGNEKLLDWLKSFGK